jgi:Zinc carboxypeptidase
MDSGNSNSYYIEGMDEYLTLISTLVPRFYGRFSMGPPDRSLLRLGRQHADFIRVRSASNIFDGFETPGTCRSDPDQRSRADVPCDSLVVELGFRPIAADSPAVVVLGPMHGDERVGASAAKYLVDLFAQRANIDPWITRLLRTRRIIVVPIPNPSGYDKHMLYEQDKAGNLIDPGIDFPFARNISGSSKEYCLLSSCASLVHHLFHQHTFVVALSLQDKTQGYESISFSWGSKVQSMCQDHDDSDASSDLQGDDKECAGGWRCPDYIALEEVADRMAAFAGPSRFDNSLLRVGPINLLGSPAHGSWVDYAYASSFRHDLVSRCGFPPATNVSHRAASFVIQASRESAPNPKNLGRLSDLYRHSSRGNVVTRVLRAALVGIDMAAPYIFFMSFGQSGGTARGGIIHARWSVGGGVTVDKTYLSCRLKNGVEWTTTHQAGKSMWAQGFEDVSGLSFYRQQRLASASYEFKTTVLLFKKLTPEQRADGTTLYLRAVAVVDQGWARPGVNGSQPQSHIVQLRTNETWFAASGHQTLRGNVLVSSKEFEIDVPPVSGLSAFLAYAYEFLLVGILMCVGPPLVLIACAGNTSVFKSSRAGVLMRQRIRRTVHALSRVDVAAEVSKMTGNSRMLKRTSSASTILGLPLSRRASARVEGTGVVQRPNQSSISDSMDESI